MDERSTTQKTLDVLKAEWQGEVVREIVAWLRARPACGTLARYENDLADQIEHEFLTDERRGGALNAERRKRESS